MPTVDIFAYGVMTYLLLVNHYPFGSTHSSSDKAIYYANVNNDKWDKDALNDLHYKSFWMCLIEPCLKGDYNKRLSDTNQIIQLFAERFPQLAKKKEDGIKYPSIVRYGLRVVYGDSRSLQYHGSEGYIELLSQDGLIRIGRETNDTHNDIVVHNDIHRFISRRHATFEWGQEEQHWYLRDGQFNMENRSWVRSKNGTYVNSREVDGVNGVCLEVDDIIYIGEIRIRVYGYDADGWMYYGGQKHENPSWTEA